MCSATNVKMRRYLCTDCSSGWIDTHTNRFCGRTYLCLRLRHTEGRHSASQQYWCVSVVYGSDNGVEGTPPPPSPRIRSFSEREEKNKSFLVWINAKIAHNHPPDVGNISPTYANRAAKWNVYTLNEGVSLRRASTSLRMELAAKVIIKYEDSMKGRRVANYETRCSNVSEMISKESRGRPLQSCRMLSRIV